MQKNYIQYGIISMVAFVPLVLIFSYKLFKTYQLSATQNLDFPLIDLILFAVFLFCLLSFYKMTIVLKPTAIQFKLGIGIIQKSYAYHTIKSSRAVRNNVLMGIGIRYFGGGWLYNVHGLTAVELTFKDKSKVIRLGTNKAQEISEELNKRIN